MKDLNFFGPYQGQKKEKINTQMYIYGAIAIVGVLIVSTLIFNNVKIYILDKSIKDYTLKLEAKEIQANLKEAEDINNEISLLKEYDSALVDISTSVKDRDIVSYELLNNISSTLPSEVSFKTLDIKENNISIQGVATNRISVAELKHNLSQLPNMQDVYVNSINSKSAVEGEYSFDIKCVLKDVE